MPYYGFREEYIYEDEENENEEEEVEYVYTEYEYEYEEIEPGQFTPNDLDEADARQAFEVLRELGALTAYCNYSGGNDEGFADFDAVELESEKVELGQLKSQLATSVLGKKPFTYEAMHSHFRNRQYSPEERVEAYLDSLARALARRLLGSGYGTGEYSLKGSLRADLVRGVIVDQQEQ